MVRRLLKIDTVESFLKAFKMEKFQLHPSFHILKLQDHPQLMAQELALYSLHYFAISYVSQSRSEKPKVKTIEPPLKPLKNIFSFVAPGSTRQFNDDRDEKGQPGYILVFTSDFFDDAGSDYRLIQHFPFFNLKITPTYITEERESTQFLNLLETIYEKFTQNEPLQFEIMRQYFRIFLLEVKRMALSRGNKNSNTAEKITHSLENLIKQYDNKHQKIKFYADHLNVNPIYLSECVKKCTGLTIKELVSKYTILEASSLLQFSTRQVGEIGKLLGFADRSNFINFFKKKTGYTPIQFRAIFSGDTKVVGTSTKSINVD